MPQLRSGKVVRASEVERVDPEVGSPGSSGAGYALAEKLVVKQRPRLAPKRKLEQSLPSFLQLAGLSGAFFKCFALPVPVRKEQGENRQKFPGKKAKGMQHRKSPRSKGVVSPVSDAAACGDWQAAATAAAMCCEETRRGTGQSQQLLFSGSALQNKLSAGIERNEYCSEGLDFSALHKGSRGSGKEGKHSCMKTKLQVPSLKGEIESTERHGISCFPEPEGFQPKKVTWNTRVECTDSIMTQTMQIPDFGKNLGAQEAMPEPKPQEEVDIPEKLNGCPLVGSRTLGMQEERTCLGKKGRRSVVKPKVRGPRERGSSALPEQHTQCPESRKGTLSMRNRNALLSQQLQDLSGQEQLITRRKTQKRCMKEEQQSSSSQKGPDSPGESAEEQWKAIEQDSGTSQSVKKVKTKQNRAEDSEEKESHYSISSTASSSGDTESKSFLCHTVTEEPGVQCRKRQRRSSQIKRLQSLSVTSAKKVMNTCAECDAEHGSGALHPCSGLLCATQKNPFVMLEDCSYINTLVKPSAAGTTNSYKLNGFFHVAHGTGDLNDGICSTSRMQKERSLIEGCLLSNKEKNENKEGCVSCLLSEGSKCLRGKNWNIGRKPRKKMKTTEKSADMATKCEKCELQTGAAIAMSSSFALSGLNHSLLGSCVRTSDFDTEKYTHDIQTVSAWRKNSTKLLAFETGSKKTSELSVIAKGKNSSSVAHFADASDSLRVLAQIHDVSDHHKSKTEGNLKKVSKKMQQFACQRTIPMTGKKVWPVESCARTSEWFLKNHRSISEGEILLKDAFEDSSDKSSVKAVGHTAITESVRQLDLYASSAGITKEITHKMIDPNIDCQASLETMESSSVDIYETLTMNNENGESPVNRDRSALAFNHDDAQEVNATLNFTAKQKYENEGDVTERNLSVTVQNDTTKQKLKNEGGVTNGNVSVTVQSDTTKRKDKNEGEVTNRNLSVTVQNGTTKQKLKNEGDVTNGNVSVTVQSDTTKRKDKNEGEVTNRNLSVTVQNGTTKQKLKNEGDVTNGNVSVTVQSDTTKRKDKNEGEVTNRNLSVTVQNGTTKQKLKNEGDVTNGNVSVTVQSDTTKRKDKNEGEVTNRNLSVTVQNGTTKQKHKNEGYGTNRNLSVTVLNGTTKQKDKNEGDVTNRNVSVTVQNDTTKRKDKNEAEVTNRNLSVTVQNGTTKQKHKNEGDVTNRNVSVTVQNDTTKQKHNNEGEVTNRNLFVTVQNGTTKQKHEKGDVTNRNLSVTVQNDTTKQKDKNEGEVANRNLTGTVQNGTSTSNTNSMNFSPEVSVVNQTFSDLNLIKPLTSGNLTKFKIPLCRNKRESKKPESVHSYESKTCSPLELLESTNPGRQKTGEETLLVKSEQCPLPVMSDATSPTLIQKNADEIDSKDFQHSGSVNLSDEMSVLPGSFSAYPHPLLDGQPEPSLPDFCGTECVLKSSYPDHSWDAVDHIAGLEVNGDRKSRGNFSERKSQNVLDVLEAYNQDVLVIDVIQDDPDLFGTGNEEELAPAHCENCPVKASSANCIKDTKEYIKPQSPVTSEKTYSVESSLRCMQESGMSSDTENSCNLMLKAEDVQTHNSSRGSSPSGDVGEDLLKDTQQSKLDELLTSLDVDEKLADGVPDVEEENKSEAEKSDCTYKVNCELLSGLPLNDRKVNLFSEATEMKSWANGYKSSERSTLLPCKDGRDFELWKMEKNVIASHSVHQILDALNLPRKYCRYYFMTLRGCERAKCWFCHVPGQGDEKICMTILRTYITIKESGLLKRAVQIFVQYYKEVAPGVDFASEVLNDLLVSLLKNCLLQEVFQILNVIVQIKTLPAVDVLLKVFEHVASLNIRNAVPTLINTFCKLIDAGMFLELEHFDYIIKLLHQLQVSSWEMTTVSNIKSRFKEKYFEKTWIFDFNLAVAEIQHCKEKRDWTKLGALYLNARTGCEHFDDLQKLFLSIAEILAEDSETNKPGVPFCDFADAVMKNSHHNKTDGLFIGRTGISIMYSYHKVLQWVKGRKVLDKLHELQINFTLLKGLVGAGRSASRCQIVNKAAEIFLHSGNLDGAIRVLRESEWITDTPLWPCDKMDILNRHNLLCAIVHKYLRKSLYRQAFEVLQNLPGLEKHSDTVDASQYSCHFNKLINACFENKNLGVSSSAVDFMLSKKIAIDFVLLRGLITALGRSSLWSKARTYYKMLCMLGCWDHLTGDGNKAGDAVQMFSQFDHLLSDLPELYLCYHTLGVPRLLTELFNHALSLGCYPELQGSFYHRLLNIPSYLSEVEMLLTIEIFLVSNASDIQSPRTTSLTLQIILKRSEDTVHNNSAYQGAVERLIQAARLSDPKLFLKHMTMNVNMEEVYSLEHSSALKWLQENMKWAEKKFHVLNRRKLHLEKKRAWKDGKNILKNKVKYNRGNAVLQSQPLSR